MKERATVDDPSLLSLAQRLRFLAKDSLLYGGAAAFNKAFALITFPLLARYFTVQEYGVIDFFTVLASLFTTFFIFGQDTAVARFFYDHEERRPRQEVISESLVFQLVLLAALLPPAWLLAGRVAGVLSDAPQPALLLRMVLLQVPFLLLLNFSQNILKWTFARSRFLLVSVGSTTVSVAGLLVGILWFPLGVAGVIGVYLATQAIFGVVGLWFVRGWLVWPREWRFLKPMVAFAAPYGVVCVVAAFIPALERTMISGFLGSRELGLFAAGAKVAMLISLPSMAFHVAWGPFSLAIYKEVDAAQTYNWVLKAFSIGILVSVLGLTTLAWPIIHLLAGDRYAGASTVVFALALGLAVEAAGWITSVGIGFSKRSHFSLYGYAAFLVVSVASMYVLLHVFGLVGIVWGALLGHLTKTVVESWFAQRVYPLPWEYSGVVNLGLFTAAIGLLSEVVVQSGGELAGALVAGAGIVAVAAFSWMRVFSNDDRAKIRSGLKRLRLKTDLLGPQ